MPFYFPFLLFVSQSHYRLECAGSRAQRHSLSKMAQTPDLSFDSLGRQYPYRHRIPLLRIARQGILDDGHIGAAPGSTLSDFAKGLIVDAQEAYWACCLPGRGIDQCPLRTQARE